MQLSAMGMHLGMSPACRGAKNTRQRHSVGGAHGSAAGRDERIHKDGLPEMHPATGTRVSRGCVCASRVWPPRAQKANAWSPKGEGAQDARPACEAMIKMAKESHRAGAWALGGLRGGRGTSRFAGLDLMGLEAVGWSLARRGKRVPLSPTSCPTKVS